MTLFIHPHLVLPAVQFQVLKWTGDSGQTMNGLMEINSFGCKWLN